MKASIDFSLFYSPTDAFGNITGDIDIPNTAAVGDEIFILESGNGDWFSGRLQITSIHQLPDSAGKPLVGLGDVVAPSQELAKNLVARLEKEKGLFFDEYE